MAINRRRFETGEPAAAEVDGAVPELGGQEAGVSAAEAQAETEVAIQEAAAPAVAPGFGLPVVWLLAQRRAMLRKPSGVSEMVEEGTVLPAYSWLPIEPGVVAVNLGEMGKWWIQMGDWVVYYRG